jgi:hypothetical protein
LPVKVFRNLVTTRRLDLTRPEIEMIRMSWDRGKWVAEFDAEAVDLLRENVEKACLGGATSIRGEAWSWERVFNLPNDQLVGQLGECALSLFLTGSSDAYFEARRQKNRFPWSGDGGSDLPGRKVDVKTSLVRSARPVGGFRLFVRPVELHDDTTYILALARPAWNGSMLVSMEGWANSGDLERTTFRGRDDVVYALPSERLRPMTSFPELLAHATS